MRILVEYGRAHTALGVVEQRSAQRWRTGRVDAQRGPDAGALCLDQLVEQEGGQVRAGGDTQQGVIGQQGQAWLYLGDGEGRCSECLEAILLLGISTQRIHHHGGPIGGRQPLGAFPRQGGLRLQPARVFQQPQGKLRIQFQLLRQMVQQAGPQPLRAVGVAGRSLLQAQGHVGGGQQPGELASLGLRVEGQGQIGVPVARARLAVIEDGLPYRAGVGLVGHNQL